MGYSSRRAQLRPIPVSILEHRRQTHAELFVARHFEPHTRLAQRTFGAHDALRDGRFRNQKRARDLLGGETAEQAQRQRDARLGGEHRMTSREHQPQQIIADVVVDD
jgi:hypothetical protein